MSSSVRVWVRVGSVSSSKVAPVAGRRIVLPQRVESSREQRLSEWQRCSERPALATRSGPRAHVSAARSARGSRRALGLGRARPATTHPAEPAETGTLPDRKRRAKIDRLDLRHLRNPLL
jgi:hypothetical protein